MSFVTYENKNNPHITIHCAGCNQIKKHGGKHTTGEGSYKIHATYQDAFSYAKSTRLTIINCSYCQPLKCVNNNTSQ